MSVVVNTRVDRLQRDFSGDDERTLTVVLEIIFC